MAKYSILPQYPTDFCIDAKHYWFLYLAPIMTVASPMESTLRDATIYLMWFLFFSVFGIATAYLYVLGCFVRWTVVNSSMCSIEHLKTTLYHSTQIQIFSISFCLKWCGIVTDFQLYQASSATSSPPIRLIENNDQMPKATDVLPKQRIKSWNKTKSQISRLIINVGMDDTSKQQLNNNNKFESNEC